ncbi:MAG: ABC transporter substrate-binding protein [Huintestinicola sp.]|uniref:ABC transporter substrate-binding protein n=1 Tax=Huintestinicola sp. TaxID=2981661 RepID=UPI003F07725C
MNRKALFFTAALALLSLCACGGEDDGADGEFYAVISDNPQNLDPQMAVDRQSMFVIRNTYALLMDTDGDGRLINGAAKSYSVSEDGLTYTFELRDGLFWFGMNGKGGVPLTAYDYEYAFRRIFDAGTHSPYAELFSCIKNSRAVYGGAKSASELGVRAQDDHTLVIELETPDCDFLKLMAHTAAAPCNEEIFLSTRGRYGLSAADTYSCGAFYISDWNYDPYWTDNHITLERINCNSSEGYMTYPQLVNIIITDERANTEKSKNFQTDAYAARTILEYDKNTARDYDIKEYVCGTACLFLNSDIEPFSDIEVRKAFFSAVDKTGITAELSEDSVLAWDIIPEAVTVANKSFRELFPQSERAVKGSASVWKKMVSEHNEIDFNSSVLLASDALSSQSMPYAIVSDLEERLELYCSPVFKNETDFRKSLQSGEETFYIDTITGDINLAEDFLESVYEACGFEDKEAEEYIARMQRCADLNEKKDIIKKAEDCIIDNAYALPLSYEKKYLLYLTDSRDIYFDPYTETMFFKYAKK